MTNTKIVRKMNELLRKHGDIDIVVYEEWVTGKELWKHKLSTIPIRNTADYNEVLRILKEGAPRRIPIKQNPSTDNTQKS